MPPRWHLLISPVQATFWRWEVVQSRCLGQKCVYLCSTFPALCQGAKCLSCSCARVSPSSALQRLASRAMGLAGPAAAPLLPSFSRRSSSPVSPGMFTGRAACVTGMAVTPSPSQPETCTSLRADVHRRGGGMLGRWWLRSESLFPQSHFSHWQG